MRFYSWSPIVIKLTNFFLYSRQLSKPTRQRGSQYKSPFRIYHLNTKLHEIIHTCCLCKFWADKINTVQVIRLFVLIMLINSHSVIRESLRDARFCHGVTVMEWRFRTYLSITWYWILMNCQYFATYNSIWNMSQHGLFLLNCEFRFYDTRVTELTMNKNTLSKNWSKISFSS